MVSCRLVELSAAKPRRILPREHLLREAIAGAHDPVCLATLALGANEFQVEHGRSPMSWNYIQYWSENLCKIHHLARLTHHKISQMRTPYLTATISPRLPPARY